MSLWKSNNIDKVWANICKHEGDVFHTVTNKGYTYVVKPAKKSQQFFRKQLKLFLR